MNISVVIPTYNRKESLRRTLDGLSRQRYPLANFEAVVVSDGSTDGTEDMLAQFAQSAPFLLRTITQRNGGPSTARNRGIWEAQYDVIVFLDDDVDPSPDFLHRHASHHVNDNRIAVLGPMSPDPSRSSDEPAWIAWEHAMLQSTYDMFRPGGEWTGHNAGPMHFYSGNASVRREWLLAVGGFDENYTRQEDVELAVRLQRECGVRFKFDFLAVGIHRPERTFESWLRIPNSYGEFDAQRIRSGLLSLSDVQHNIKKRNVVTRTLTRVCLVWPGLLSGLIVLFKRSVTPLYRSGIRSSALAALSAMYNLCYVTALTRNNDINADKD
jgi:glycosyltransferase involved in cell wall biosynthesis